MTVPRGLPSSRYQSRFGRCRGGWRTRVVGRAARRQRGAALAPPADRRPLAAAPPSAGPAALERTTRVVGVGGSRRDRGGESVDSLRFGGARSPLVAGVLGFAIGLLAFVQVRPSLPAGDEPHYLVITQSLLEDGDLRIENNHRQRDYRSYFAGDLPPDFRVRGRNREIYSIHAPGVSAFVAPAFFVGGYRGVVLFLLLLSAAGSALTWHLARLLTGRDAAAWFGWAAVTCSATWVFHSFAVFPDGPGAVALLTGVWALFRAQREAESNSPRSAPWFWHGLALALMPWMHTRFAALAGTMGALVLLRLGPHPTR